MHYLLPPLSVIFAYSPTLLESPTSIPAIASCHSIRLLTPPYSHSIATQPTTQRLLGQVCYSNLLISQQLLNKSVTRFHANQNAHLFYTSARNCWRPALRGVGRPDKLQESATDDNDRRKHNCPSSFPSPGPEEQSSGCLYGYGKSKRYCLLGRPVPWRGVSCHVGALDCCGSS